MVVQVLGRQKQVGLLMFKASLVYTPSSTKFQGSQNYIGRPDLKITVGTYSYLWRPM